MWNSHPPSSGLHFVGSSPWNSELASRPNTVLEMKVEVAKEAKTVLTSGIHQYLPGWKGERTQVRETRHHSQTRPDRKQR